MTDKSKHDGHDINFVLADLLAKVPDFSVGVAEGLDFSDMISSKLDREDFPVPELVLFVLRNALHWSWYGKGEKVRWSIHGAVGGEPVIFELAKFGLRIYRSRRYTLPTKRVTGQLRAAIKVAEKWLQPYVNTQIRQGDVIIANYVPEFTGRYEYFRKNADRAYRRAKGSPRPRQPKQDEVFSIIGDIMHSQNHRRKAETNGFYNSVAMVDCYFSSLEHRLTLLRAFTGKPMNEGGLQDFLKKPWDKKLNEILGQNQPASTGQLVNELRDIKERIRNPFAHGGFENDKGALHVHVPSLGSIPGNFTRFGKSVRFSSLPVEANDHAKNCIVFDNLDCLLQSNQLAAPHELMMAGIDPSFDAQSLQHYHDAVSGDDEALQGFIDYWSYQYETEANMDY